MTGGKGPIVFGATYSVYTRIVRLALEEKGIAYRLEEVDIFADGGPPSDYDERHPFLRIPAFEQTASAFMNPEPSPDISTKLSRDRR